MLIIDKEFQKLIPPLLPEEIEVLKNSIKKEGIREALLTWNDILIDGHNRFDIAKKLNLPYKIEKLQFENRTEAILWMIDNQLGRRNISNYDRTRLALKYEELIKPKALERQKGGQGGGLLQQKSAKAIETRKEVSKIAKVSHDTVSKVKFIEKHANEEQKEKLSRQTDSINKVYNEVKKRIIESSENTVTKIPEGAYNLIYADPPWKYNFSQTIERSIETNYNTMSLDQIKNMEIPTEQNAILLLWATAPKLKEAIEVMDFWGFEYKTCAVWDKEIIGMGYWFRGQHELLLVGTKGKVHPPKEKDRISSVLKYRRTKHSKKPEELYDLIENMYPDGKYLELFARNKRKNWTSWGNEV